MEPKRDGRLLSNFSATFVRQCQLPAQVFRAGFRGFGFLEFQLLAEEYLRLLQALANWSQDTVIRLVTTEPDFAALNDDAHTVAIPVAGSFEDYIKVFLANDRTLDTMYAGAWFSDSAQWGIWGVRMLSTMVVGFRREPPKPFAELARECGLRPQTMDEILDLTRLDFGIGYSKPPKPEWVDKYEQYCAEFRRNYSR